MHLLTGRRWKGPLMIYDIVSQFDLPQFTDTFNKANQANDEYQAPNDKMQVNPCLKNNLSFMFAHQICPPESVIKNIQDSMSNDSWYK